MSRHGGAVVAIVTGLLGQVLWAQPQVRPIKRPDNNELDLVELTAPDRVVLPGAVAGTTERLSFHTSPLSSKGLLSEQVRSAIKALDKANGSGTILKLRAFVAGTGDMRRVQSIVAEIFAGKKWPLPAVTTIQVGGLPLENAQVVIEAISEEKKKSVNPGGLVFFSPASGASAEQAVARLDEARKATGAALLRITCFTSTLEGAEAARLAAAKAFPRVPGAFAQLTRYNPEPRVACEGVGRLPKGQADAPTISALDVPGLEPMPDRAHAVLVRHPRLIFTAAQMAFRDTNEDIRLAYERLGKTIEELGASYEQVVASHIYALTAQVRALATDLRDDFVSPDARPARSIEVFEGLPSIDASMAVEIVAAARN